jgi:hypothetical protein
VSYQLVVEKGRSKGKALRLKPNGSAVIGREGSNALVISDPQTSRKHFQIAAKLGEFVLEDLGSSNGTFVNGERVEEKRTLQPGDKIAVGETLVYFLKETGGGAENRKGELSSQEISGYRLGRLLGRGGMGTVYEAVQISLERTVAFKVLARELTSNPEFIERFVSEARAAGRLSHANIVAVFDVGKSDDVHFYSMEYMSGGSVDDLLRKRGPLPFEETIPIIFDAARGLEYAEKHGLIHRDIKPDNLMLGADDVVKICDLGLATFQSRQHEVSGSPHYIAPEQALGKEIDHRVDLYSLGVTWYELLCGETPFSGNSPEQVARKHVEEEPPPLSERAPAVPADVVAVVERLMAKDRDERMPSARQLQADLAALARRYPIRETVLLRIDAVAPDEPPSEELLAAEPVAGSSRVLSYAALALLAVGLLAGAFLLTRAVMDSGERRREEARASLDQVRGLLTAGELEQAQAEAMTLAQRLADQGLDEEASAAQALGDQAGERLAAGRKAEQEAAARAKLDEASRLFEQQKTTKPEDRATPARLTEVERLLGAVIEEYPSTQAAAEADRLRAEVVEAGREAKAAQKRLAERQQKAADAAKRAESSIRRLLESDERGRFALALEHAEEFTQKHGDVAPRPGPVLKTEIRAAAVRDVKRCTAESLRHAGNGRWTEAREALAPVQPPLGFPDLEETVRKAARTVQESQGSAARVAADRRRQEEEERLRRILEALEPVIGERDFARAASDLRGELPHFQVDEVKRQAEAIHARFEAAARAIDALVEHVRAKKPGISLTFDFGKKGEQEAEAYEVDARGQRLKFQWGPYVRSKELGELEPAQLLRLSRVAASGRAGTFQLGCLALAMGLRMEGTQILTELRALDPAWKARIDQQLEHEAGR